MEGEHNLIWVDKEPPYYKNQSLAVHYVLPHKCGTTWLEMSIQDSNGVGHYFPLFIYNCGGPQIEEYHCQSQGFLKGVYPISLTTTTVFRVCFIDGKRCEDIAEVRALYLDNFTTRPAYIADVAELTISIDDGTIEGVTYIEQTSVSVTHQITSTVVYAKSLQWQELKSGTWENIEGETAVILTIGTWTGELADDEETARANTNAIIPAYDRRFRCVATNEVGSTVSAVLHVVHAEGNGTPTITEE